MDIGLSWIFIPNSYIDVNLDYMDMVADETGREVNIPTLWLIGKNGHMIADAMLDVSIMLINRRIKDMKP